MVYFHYQNIYTARSFFSLHTSNKTVQQAVPLIATDINDKALKMNKKNAIQEMF